MALWQFAQRRTKSASFVGLEPGDSLYGIVWWQPGAAKPATVASHRVCRQRSDRALTKGFKPAASHPFDNDVITDSDNDVIIAPFKTLEAPMGIAAYVAKAEGTFAGRRGRGRFDRRPAKLAHRGRALPPNGPLNPERSPGDHGRDCRGYSLCAGSNAREGHRPI